MDDAVVVPGVVERGGGVVEDENLWFAKQCTGNTVADSKAAVDIILTRNGVTETNVCWFAIGTGVVAT